MFSGYLSANSLICDETNKVISHVTGVAVKVCLSLTRVAYSEMYPIEAHTTATAALFRSRMRAPTVIRLDANIFYVTSLLAGTLKSRFTVLGVPRLHIIRHGHTITWNPTIK
jgi:hypothetical protein